VVLSAALKSIPEGASPFTLDDDTDEVPSMRADVRDRARRSGDQRRRCEHDRAETDAPKLARLALGADRRGRTRVAWASSRPYSGLPSHWFGLLRRVFAPVAVRLGRRRRDAVPIYTEPIPLAVGVLSASRTGRMGSRTSAQAERQTQQSQTVRRPCARRHEAPPIWAGARRSGDQPLLRHACAGRSSRAPSCPR
jgi:hypothetical protein